MFLVWLLCTFNSINNSFLIPTITIVLNIFCVYNVFIFIFKKRLTEKITKLLFNSIKIRTVWLNKYTIFLKKNSLFLKEGMYLDLLQKASFDRFVNNFLFKSTQVFNLNYLNNYIIKFTITNFISKLSNIVIDENEITIYKILLNTLISFIFLSQFIFIIYINILLLV
jgi:hypothetical protein